MRMNKILLNNVLKTAWIVCAWLCATCALAQEADRVYVSGELSFKPGGDTETQYFSVNIADASMDYVAYQLDIVLPEGLEIIGNMAFFRMACIETVDLPSTLRVIGSNAFYFCTELTGVTGGENLQELRDYAFCYCPSLTTFRIPDSVTELGANVFAGCSSLKTVHLPKALENPSASLFDESCTSLAQIYVNASVRPRIYFILGPLQQAVNVDYYK
jgi:hypothetical protein